MKRTLKPFLLSAVLATGGSALAADGGTAPDGAALFARKCASCHGKDAKSGKAAPIAGLAEEKVAANIKTHPNSMDTFGLSEEQSKALAKYVAGLKK
jgi:cytochrome c6